LTYQLLKDDAPPGSMVIRTGNPDGGVEWYAKLSDGSQWGWQAKNIAKIDDLLKAMTKSVEAVVAERPFLTHLTFVISTNLPAGSSKGKNRSQRQKYEDQVNTWKEKIPGAERITIALVQESDLLDKLALPQHQGRVWFWWQSLSLGLDWLRALYQRQADIAGGKYRPDLQVDVPIAEDLEGLGFSERFVDEYGTLRRNLRQIIQDQREVNTPFAELNAAGQSMLNEVKSLAAKIDQDEPISITVSGFEALGEAIRATLAAAQAVSDLGFRLMNEVEGRSDKVNKETSDHLNHYLYSCRRLRESLADLQEWLNRSSTRAFRSRLYYLVGPAGSGKTHLLLDGVRVALDEERPAVVLHGAQFRSALWADICEQMGLPPLGADVVLGAMDSAAEAAGLDGRHFVLAIDALNETQVPGYWETYLPILRSEISRWPHLALAVSCRDTYLDVIDPSNERERFVLASHPGFAGREIEATQKYFHHYGLQEPRIPLLTPEFTVPLFLRLYCEGLRDSGRADAAVGHEGRVEIFERYLSSRVARVAQRVYPQSSGNLEAELHRKRVQGALDALLDAMSNADSEWLTIDTATEIVANTISGADDRAVTILSAFENEGVLIQEPSYLGGYTDSIALRVTFQAFSDFLLLQRRLSRVIAPLEDEDFKTWLHDRASWGILEAATIVVPEKYGVEVPDLLGIGINDLAWNDTQGRRINRNRHIFESLLSTLPHRAEGTINPRTIELLNIGLRSPDIDFDLYKVIYAIAPQPNNPLNAYGLHHHLAKQSMPRRDSTFGFEVYDEIWNEASAITRLARWAALGPYPSYPSEVIDLAATALTWLLSSPNRFMRDWVTKCLVQLLYGHLGVMKSVFERLWEVNDPYVVQRVTVVAYGCLMRGGNLDLDGAGKVAELVLDRVFTKPMRADELMLDAGRGVVEWGVMHGVLSADALDATKRPYGFKVPGNPPTMEKLESTYDHGYPHRISDAESYGTIWSSLLGMADFGRYVVDSGVEYFSRYRHGQEKPSHEAQEPRPIIKNWKAFVASLTPDQIAMLEKWESDPSSPPADWLLSDSSPNRITKEQLALLDAAWTRPRPVANVDDRYPRGRARRWVFRRTLSLGWTPQLFGKRDWLINRMDQGRSEHKAERWGKKYQWMAYHELLARIADNFPLASYSGDEELYDGLQQFIGEREVDPSLPPIEYRALSERRGQETLTWPPSSVHLRPSLSPQLSFQSYHGDIDRFVEHQESYPTGVRAVQASDGAGEVWIALDGYEEQTERPEERGTKNLNQLLWLYSVFVPQKSALRDAQDILKARREGSFEFDRHGHVDCCYASEIGWSQRSCPHSLDRARQVEFDGRSMTVIDTVENYTWEGNILDCSIGEPVWATMPSSYVRSRSALEMIVEGPGWIDTNGQLVASYIQSSDDRWSGRFWQGFFVRQSWLQYFLEQEGLALAIVSKFERRLLDQERTRDHRYIEVWSGALLSSAGQFRTVGSALSEEGPPREVL
jgi:hypothetical protein